MDSSYTSPGKSARARALVRPFVIVRYLAGGGGYRPEVPDRCPVVLATPDGTGERNCAVQIDHYRDRKTGPKFPLAVCRCETHRIGFTIYPAGFGPYLRQSVDRIEASGELPEVPQTTDVATSDRVQHEFEGTVFEAALCAADGAAWARDSVPSAVGGFATAPDRWWSSQLRRIALGLRVLGLAPDVQDEPRVRIGEVLGIPTTRLFELGKSLSGYRSRGKAIRVVLSLLVRAPSRAFDLLTCFHLAGCFGQPMPWCARRGFLPRRAFPYLDPTDGL